jgi:hypothetical protein
VLDVLVVLIEEMDQPTADIIDLIAEKLIFATVRSSPPAVTVCARTFKAVTPSRPFLSVLLACAARRLRPMRKASNAAAHFIMLMIACSASIALCRTLCCAPCHVPGLACCSSRTTPCGAHEDALTGHHPRTRARAQQCARMHISGAALAAAHMQAHSAFRRTWRSTSTT